MRECYGLAKLCWRSSYPTVDGGSPFLRFATALLSLLILACASSKSASAQSALTVAPGFSPAAPPQPGTSAPLGPAEEPVQAQLRHVDFHVDSSIVLHIHNLRGELLRTARDTPPTFDEKNSFTLKIDSGEIGVTAGHLAELMNRYLLAYPGAPLRNVKLSFDRNRLKQKADLKKGAWIPFEAEGSLSATPDGVIAFHVTAIRSAHLPIKGLMDLLSVKVADLINVNQSRGMRVKGNDIFLYPERIIPPPRIRGRITAVRIEGEELVQVFGGAEGKSSENVKALSPPRAAPNYMYFRGGTLRFGKLTMTNADLQIIDTDSRDYFDFDLAQYNRQLAAGCSKSTGSYGLIVFMPDLHRIRQVDRQAAKLKGH